MPATCYMPLHATRRGYTPLHSVTRRYVLQMFVEHHFTETNKPYLPVVVLTPNSLDEYTTALAHLTGKQRSLVTIVAGDLLDLSQVKPPSETAE